MSEKMPLLQSQGGEGKSAYFKWVVGDFRQTELIEKYDSNTRKGVCMAVCVRWIEHHKTVRSCFGYKKPTDIRLAALKKSNEIDAICRSQAVYGDYVKKISNLGDASEYKETLNEFVGNFDLSLSRETKTIYLGKLSSKFSKASNADAFVDDSSYLFEEMATFVKQKHRYHIINLDGQTPHTICCYMSSGTAFGYGTHLYVFEPNRGEFKVPANEVDEFFACHMYEAMSAGMSIGSMTAFRIA